jgi:hypothetical protein
MCAKPTLLSAILLSGLAALPDHGNGLWHLSRNGNVQAQISWNSTSDRGGAMTAMLSNGKIYNGSYFQITPTRA